MSIEIVPKDVLNIILEYVDFYTLLTSVPIVCKKFNRIITNEFKYYLTGWMTNQEIPSDSFAYSWRVLYVNRRIKDKITPSKIYTDILVSSTNNPREDTPRYFFIIGEGEGKVFMFIAHVDYEEYPHIFPMIDDNKSIFYQEATNLRSLMKVVHQYTLIWNIIKIGVEQAFYRNNDYHNFILKQRLADYKDYILQGSHIIM